MKHFGIYYILKVIALSIFITSCGSDDSSTPGTPSVFSQFYGSWQNTVITTNWWVITEDSIINYGLYPPSPCVKIIATILSETSFTFDEGTGSGTQITMNIINDELLLLSPLGTATHSRMNHSDIPSSCTSL